MIFSLSSDWQGKRNRKKISSIYRLKECIKNNWCRVTLEVCGDNSNAIKLYSDSGYIGNENSENNCLIFAMKKDFC